MNILETSPQVSIAIITYNQKDFLRECIDSCLAQDYPNFEIVVADDGSTDGSQEMLLEYSRRYSGKFVLRLSSSNKGITENSNLAHFACSGEYIAWMGGDDLMLPGKLTKQVEFMEKNPHCAISYHNLDVFDSDTNSTIYFFNDKLKLEGDARISIRNGTFNGACSNMVRADKTPQDGFDSRIPIASDWLYWVETLANGGTINYIDEVLGRYRRHTKNITKNLSYISQNEIDHIITCSIIISKYPQYICDAIYFLDNKILGLRHKEFYFPITWASIKFRVTIKASIALIVFAISFGKIRL